MQGPKNLKRCAYCGRQIVSFMSSAVLAVSPDLLLKPADALLQALRLKCVCPDKRADQTEDQTKTSRSTLVT